ncbi:MFS transporter [Scopulibacillus cellulosilyticus]|uniref:MFS transporter n=1 Tax=Scopulibacillus cellulosilyticus TaxID=2665665 RepID=A0ABW2PYD2_9BACL
MESPNSEKVYSLNSKVNQRRTKVRYFIVFLLFLATIINYLDRANLSVVGPSIGKSLDLSAGEMGLIFSAFGWTYAIMQIPGGWILDRLGSKITYGFSLLIWSILTCFQGLANGFGLLFGLRLGIGFSEAPAFPTNNRVVSTWFPQKERAFATGVFTAGEYVGLGFLTPILFWLLSTFGWESVFIVSGAAGIIFSCVWLIKYNDPAKDKKVNQAELNYIREGGGVVENKSERSKISWSQVASLFKHRQLIGIYIGQIGITATLWFFLTWFPTYLVDEKHMTILHVGFVAAIPYIAAFIGVLFGGFLSDWMIHCGISVSISRKLPIIIGLLLSSSIILANYTSSVPLVITIMSIAFFAQGMAAISWTMVSEIAPPELMGLAGGVFNFAGNLSSIIVPIVIGFIVGATHSFGGALAFVAAIAVIGALSYIFIVGEVKRVKME